jgi:hypothetical protein
MNRRQQQRRLTIERIDLDCRGMPAASAEAMARALGPALARALSGEPVRVASAERIDAGSVARSRAPEPEMLAADIAQRIAQQLRRRDD